VGIGQARARRRRWPTPRETPAVRSADRAGLPGHPGSCWPTWADRGCTASPAARASRGGRRSSIAAQPRRRPSKSSMAKCFAADSAVKVATGRPCRSSAATAYTREYPVERFMRDAKDHPDLRRHEPDSSASFIARASSPGDERRTVSGASAPTEVARADRGAAGRGDSRRRVSRPQSRRRPGMAIRAPGEWCAQRSPRPPHRGASAGGFAGRIRLNPGRRTSRALEAPGIRARSARAPGRELASRPAADADRRSSTALRSRQAPGSGRPGLRPADSGAAGAGIQRFRPAFGVDELLHEWVSPRSEPPCARCSPNTPGRPPWPHMGQRSPFLRRIRPALRRPPRGLRPFRSSDDGTIGNH